MPVPVEGFAHVRITVTDIDRSKQFYDSVFGWDVAFELPDGADEKTREQLGFLFGGVIYAFGGGLFGLRPVASESDEFSEDRVGLDHVSFAVASMDALRDAAATLDSLGVEHEQIKDLGRMAILEFRDPDGVALELTAPTA